jgi:glycosyltransferase involved in cell wall biosynthesis
VPEGRILLAVTADVSIGFVAGTARYLAAQGWDVHVASGAGPRLERLGEEPGITVHPTSVERDPSLRSDATALLAVVRLVRRIRPDVVSAATPKAGLLFSLAAAVLRVPVRVYQLWGLRYETERGLRRRVLMATERLAAGAATDVLAVSASLQEIAVRDRLVRARKTQVLGAGSSHGVDPVRFAVDAETRRDRQQARWPEDRRPVIGFVGRLNPDKGIDTLAAAARILSARGVEARLVIVGSHDGAAEDVIAQLTTCGWPCEFWGQTDDVAGALSQMDVLCLPTRREGFPNVVLEAAVAGLPTVATPATGVVDAVQHERTGLLAASFDPSDLADQLARVVTEPALRQSLGRAARDRAIAEFDQTRVWHLYADFYASRLGRR